MASTHFTTIATLFIIFFISPSSSTTTFSIYKSTPSFSSSSIYDLLNSHGLPIGLLPKGISNFSIDSSSGYFEAHLRQSCGAQFETHLRYDTIISGTLNYGHISNITGVAAQELFLWFAVKGIRVDIPSSGLIYFDVGVVSKQFSLSFFETPRDCTVTNDGLPDNLILVDHRGRIFEVGLRTVYIHPPLTPPKQSRKIIKERPQKSMDRAVS